jgi:hypothetical protein
VAHSEQFQGESRWLGTKAMVHAPPGYAIVGAHIDQEELGIWARWGMNNFWIAWLYGARVDGAGGYQG